MAPARRRGAAAAAKRVGSIGRGEAAPSVTFRSRNGARSISLFRSQPCSGAFPLPSFLAPVLLLEITDGQMFGHPREKGLRAVGRGGRGGSRVHRKGERRHGM